MERLNKKLFHSELLTEKRILKVDDYVNKKYENKNNNDFRVIHQNGCLSRYYKGFYILDKQKACYFETESCYFETEYLYIIFLDLINKKAITISERNNKIYFYKNSGEVDFFIKKGNLIIHN